MTDDDDHSRQHKRIQDILLLPPLPAVACRLLDLIANDQCDIGELSTLIEQDPGLAARIVGIANSAYFARPTEISSVADAIVRVLGLNLVRGIAVGIALSKPFDVSACPEFQLERYWYRAIQTANLCGRLAPRARLPEELRRSLFLCGLLHNLGQLVLVHAFPDRMGRVFRDWAAAPERGLLSLENEQLAMTEIEAGTILARRWQLPAAVTDVIEFRHEPWRAGAAAPLVELVTWCARFAAALYDDPDAQPAPTDTADGTSPGWDAADIDKAVAQIRAQDEQTRAFARTLANTH
ncbi:MAG: HDOD domain-containing protein [Gammaproteobacteria bacterium]|nr:HDOD domain-containing protein [Gammaproteobacteria bacterium]